MIKSVFYAPWCRHRVRSVEKLGVFKVIMISKPPPWDVFTATKFFCIVIQLERKEAGFLSTWAGGIQTPPRAGHLIIGGYRNANLPYMLMPGQIITMRRRRDEAGRGGCVAPLFLSRQRCLIWNATPRRRRRNSNHPRGFDRGR